MPRPATITYAALTGLLTVALFTIGPDILNSFLGEASGSNPPHLASTLFVALMAFWALVEFLVSLRADLKDSDRTQDAE